MAVTPAPSQTNGTITTGGTAQVGATADSTRAFIIVQNNHASEDLWINFQTTAATDAGIKIPGGGSGEWAYGDMPQIKNAMSIIAATTGHKFGITADVN